MNGEDITPLEAASSRFFELINFNDSQSGQRQFAEFCTEVVRKADVYGEQPEDLDAVWIINDIIVGRSGFYVGWKDTESFIDTLESVCEQRDVDIEINWGMDDPDDEDFFDTVSVPELMEIATRQLAREGLTLWNWDTGGDAYGGWLTRTEDDEEMLALAELLGVDIRRGDQPF